MNKTELKNVLRYLGYTNEEVTNKYIKEWLVGTGLGVIIIFIFDIFMMLFFNVDTNSKNYFIGILSGILIGAILEFRSKVFEDKVIKEANENGLNIEKIIYSTKENNYENKKDNSSLIKKGFKIKGSYIPNDCFVNLKE